ncbi:MAG: 4-hydroxy-3-methylbut-2-enyl diphosphate reductase [Planctomycetota bacterium]|nr:MAG: 4-hydroxy-3-methylbut-2-enyl diphosphate reductase [Planctomycetota bacterium]
MKLSLATAMGTCFGVQDAIDLALSPEFKDRLTVVGQLVHNPQTVERLRANGVAIVERHEIDHITTQAVMITAHGAADTTRLDLQQRGFTVYDATCPLVMRLHKLARYLERKGYFPVIVGQANHVEVQGVLGNLSRSAVIAGPQDFHKLEGETRIGVVSQTTNRLQKVEQVVAGIQALPWIEEVRFVDTICQPVKDRQQAIGDLLQLGIDLGIVIGGKNSANTRKLKELMIDRGVEAHHVESIADIDEEWFCDKEHVGITAGTSTPQDVIEEVSEYVRQLIAKRSGPAKHTSHDPITPSASS